MSHAAFLDAIRATPDDDTARLVFADYLDELGGPADTTRAEFIRTQIRLSALDETDPARPALEDRENELLRAHEHEWVGKLPAALAQGLVRWRFERGFLDKVQIGVRVLASRGGAALFKSHPVSWVRLAGPDASELESVETLATRPWWARVRDLDTGDSAASSVGTFEPLLVSPELTGLLRLSVTANGDRGLPQQLPEILGKCPSLSGLRELTVRDWRHDTRELLSVLEASGVRRLRFAYCEHSTRGLRELLTSPFAARPVELELENGTLGATLWPALRAKRVQPIITRMNFASLGRNPDLDLPTLLSVPATANLKALDVSETGLSGTNVRVIAKSGFLARATELGLTRSHVNAKVMAALAKVEAPTLRKLTLGETGLRNAGVFALCEARWADSLTHLDLMRNELDDQALIAMADSGRFVNLRALDLRVNSPDLGDECRAEIGDAGALALAAAPNFARLRHLNLYRTRVTVRGVDALLNGPHCRLAELELGGYDLGPDLPTVLARSPGLARLTKLSLSFTPTLGDNALLPLAESPHLSPLCRLDIRYNNVSDRVSAKLAARLGRRLENYPAAGVW